MGEIEIPLATWEPIALTLGLSLRSVYRRRDELLEAGVIFYRRVGRPPRRTVYHFPSRLKAWTGLKASKGEYI